MPSEYTESYTRDHQHVTGELRQGHAKQITRTVDESDDQGHHGHRPRHAGHGHEPSALESQMNPTRAQRDWKEDQPEGCENLAVGLR